MSMRYGFSLKLDCSNAAFDEGQRPNEVARILRRLADQIEIVPLSDNQRIDGRLFDANGNTCGSWEAKPRRIRD
jgi:hypothetical protein